MSSPAHDDDKEKKWPTRSLLTSSSLFDRKFPDLDFGRSTSNPDGEVSDVRVPSLGSLHVEDTSTIWRRKLDENLVG